MKAEARTKLYKQNSEPKNHRDLIHKFLLDNPKSEINSIMEHFSLTRSSIRMYLRALINIKLVIREGSYRTYRYSANGSPLTDSVTFKPTSFNSRASMYALPGAAKPRINPDIKKPEIIFSPPVRKIKSLFSESAI